MLQTRHLRDNPHPVIDSQLGANTTTRIETHAIRELVDVDAVADHANLAPRNTRDLNPRRHIVGIQEQHGVGKGRRDGLQQPKAYGDVAGPRQPRRPGIPMWKHARYSSQARSDAVCDIG
jgi:hypothetical protein